MKTLIIVCLMLLQAPSAFKQSPEIAGNWTFHKLETTTPMEDETKAILTRALSAVNYDFKNDGTYILQKRKKTETGTWKSNKKSITTTNSTGYTESIEYIQKHKDTLKLELEKNQYAVFVRKE